MVANFNTAVFYLGILTLKNVGTALIYRDICITLAPGAPSLKNKLKKFCEFQPIKAKTLISQSFSCVIFVQSDRGGIRKLLASCNQF